MKLFLCSIIFVLIFPSCSNTQNLDNNIDKEIEKLSSKESRKHYLENIFNLDQKFRLKSGDIIAKFGYKSPEHLENSQNRIETDSLNLIKVEKYILNFGYPSKVDLGEIAASTPWAVIHHSSSYEVRKRNFDHLYKAFKNGDISDGSFSMYLDRSYKIKTGRNFRMEGKFKETDRINRLIKSLNFKN